MANKSLDELRKQLLTQLKEKFEKTDPKKDSDEDQEDESDDENQDDPKDDSDEDDDEEQEDDETDISKDSGKKDKIEVKEDTDLVESFLSDISEQKGPEAKELFENIIMSKITSRLEEMRQEVMGESGYAPFSGGSTSSSKPMTSRDVYALQKERKAKKAEQKDWYDKDGKGHQHGTFDSTGRYHPERDTR